MSLARLAGAAAFRATKPTCTVPAIGDVPGTIRFSRKTAGKNLTLRAERLGLLPPKAPPIGLQEPLPHEFTEVENFLKSWKNESMYAEPSFNDTQIALAEKGPKHTPWPAEARVDEEGQFTHATSFRDETTPRHPKDPGLTELEFSGRVLHGRGFYDPVYHPRTHGIPVALIHFRSYEHHQMDRYLHFVAHTAAALGIPISKPAYLPKQRSLFTVLRGPFAHKKSQENFERIVYKRAIKAWDADPVVIDRWIKYLHKHAMAGTGMRVTRWTRMPVGIGASLSQEFDSQIADKTSRDRVKALGEKIVVQELAALARKDTPLTTHFKPSPTYNQGG